MIVEIEKILKDLNEKVTKAEKEIARRQKEIERARRAHEFYVKHQKLLEVKIKTEREVSRISNEITKLMKKRKALREKLNGINKEYESRWLKEVIRKNA